MKTYYELLGVARNASTDEIKRAFRREIAKYHPDKVQHLGQEFQDIAAAKAAELTQAYKTLTDPAARADYDALVDQGLAEPVKAPPPAGSPRPAPEQPAEPRRPPPRPEPQVPGADLFSEERAGVQNLITRATLARFRAALEAEFGTFDSPAVGGFQVACVPAGRFWSLRPPPRLLARFVDKVDRGAVIDSWTAAAKLKSDPQRDLVVFVMGPAVASAGELAAAISEQKKKPVPGGGKLVLVPVNTRTWSAHVPTDAPPVVKSLLKRLQSA
ncbi:MAG TPA: J domain-containing protein [Vicinamibacterales bacterium]|nr:J domain-containing protein [Vicinamibacterales bacterium]